MNKYLIAILAIIALAGFAFGIKRYLPSFLFDQGESALENKNQDKQENLPVVSQEESSLEDLQVKEIVLEASEFKYDLEQMNLKKGEKVKLTLMNVGKMPHDFVIDELGVRTEIINGGETDTIEFVPGKTGNFEFYCSVGNHRQLGMVGKVVIE